MILLWKRLRCKSAAVIMHAYTYFSVSLVLVADLRTMSRCFVFKRVQCRVEAQPKFLVTSRPESPCSCTV
jgi:hypothetical protein